MKDTKQAIDITKKADKKAYADDVLKKMPKSKTFCECIRAFLTGGAICVIGQALSLVFSEFLGFDEKSAASLTTAAMIFLGALFTGLGLYDVLGSFAGAGSIVPVTGFANSIVSPAMEFKREGLVLGVGAKLFTVAGPVLVYGISFSTLMGIIYYILKCLNLA